MTSVEPVPVQTWPGYARPSMRMAGGRRKARVGLGEGTLVETEECRRRPGFGIKIFPGLTLLLPGHMILA